MKRAIIITFFGTTKQFAIENTLMFFKQKIQSKFKEVDVFIAFSSEIICKKLLINNNIKVYCLEEVLFRLKDRYQDILLLNLNLTQGLENNKIEKIVSEYRPYFNEIIITDPLLTLDENNNLINGLAIVEVIRKIKPKNEAILFVGHGIKDNNNLPYIKLEDEVKKTGIQNVYFGTLNGSPGFEEVIAQMKNDKIDSVVITPFLIVSGYHASVDIFGDNINSWSENVDNFNIFVKSSFKGLLERKEIINLYLEILLKYN